MAGYVYLIRNRELYKIGKTRKIGARLAQLKPCEVLGIYTVSDPENIEYVLHRMFKAKRLPQTEYFRLSSDEVDRAKIFLENHDLKSLSPPRPPTTVAPNAPSSTSGSPNNSILLELKRKADEAKAHEFLINNTKQLRIDQISIKEQVGTTKESQLHPKGIKEESKSHADEESQQPHPEAIAKPGLSDYIKDWLTIMLVIGLTIATPVLGFRLINLAFRLVLTGITAYFRALFS